MKLISGQVDAYRRFRLENRELIRLYLTLIGLVLLVTLFLSTWIGFYVGRRITEPIKAVAGAAREISAGNLDVRVDDRAGDEVGVLIDAFNDMAAQLQESRAVIQRSNADLLSSNRELDERRRYIETLVASLSTAVLSLDHEGRVTTSNPAVERVVGKRIEPGTSIREAFDPPGLAPLREFVLCEIANDTGESSAELVLDRGGAVVTVSARVATLGGRRGEPIGRLLMVEDVTDVVLAQRAAAWREAARRIAHEIKNPLTPIQLSAQRLRKKFADGAPDLAAVVADATSAIEREVGGLKYLVDEFSRYARMPELRLESVDPAEVVRSVVALYAGESGIVWDVRAEPGMPPVRIDPEQIRRVLINLVDNSIAAMRRRGMIAIAAGVDPARRSLRLEVADSGPGIPSAERDRLFVPYFSTKHAGTGLGLAIVQRVVSEHRGTIHVEDNVPRGARFVIEIPV
jgi:two-component system nitrogen regulation sensor histidine kinase NtrY